MYICGSDFGIVEVRNILKMTWDCIFTLCSSGYCRRASNSFGSEINLVTLYIGLMCFSDHIHILQKHVSRTKHLERLTQLMGGSEISGAGNGKVD